MSVEEILEQAKALSDHERRELVKRLVDSFSVSQPDTSVLSGSEIVALLRDMEPIAFVDPEIDDPVAWVKAQRRKDTDRLAPYWNSEK
jgi:hypothetical protein